MEDLSDGDIQVGFDSQGIGGTAGNIVSMNSLPPQLVCQPGAVLVNGTECGKLNCGFQMVKQVPL